MSHRICVVTYNYAHLQFFNHGLLLELQSWVECQYWNDRAGILATRMTELEYQLLE